MYVFVFLCFSISVQGSSTPTSIYTDQLHNKMWFIEFNNHFRFNQIVDLLKEFYCDLYERKKKQIEKSCSVIWSQFYWKFNAKLKFKKILKMISSISPSGSVDSYSPYVQFSNNGYLIDENLNSVQSDRLQRVAKQFSELSSKMGANDVDATFTIKNESTSAQKKWYATDESKVIVNGERFSTSTDDSDSSASFKNGADHSQIVLDNKSDEDKPMPDHHARRPMNAFLIFCKRHRAIVRERYPNLENR